MAKYRKFLIVSILIFVLFALFYGEKKFLNNKIIGMSGHPGLQGEILFQENIVYNFKKGNLLRYFNTDYLNYPAGENLGFAIANSFHLYMYLPLRLFLGVIESYNALVIIIFLLNFLSAYLLAKYLFSSRRVAFCSAMVFALNSYVLLKMHMGFIQKYALFFLPLYCLMLFKLRDTKKWKYAFGSVFILCLIQLFYPPYAYYAVIFTFALALYTLSKTQELKFVLTRLCFLVALTGCFLFLIYYLMGFKNICFEMIKEKYNLRPEGSLDLFRLFRCFPYHSSGYTTNLSLGVSISAFLLATLAFIKRKGMSRLIYMILLFFIIIAAGPFLEIAGRRICLPFYFMAKYLPFAGWICFPIRVFPFINLCLSILAGYGLLYIISVFKKVKPLFIIFIFSSIYIAENLFLFPQIFPPKISEANTPAFLEKMKKEDFKALLDLPVAAKSRKMINYYGYLSALCGKGMMNSYCSDELSVYIPRNHDDEAVKKDFLSRLSKWRVGYILVHKDFLNSETGLKEDEFSWLSLYCKEVLYPEENILAYKVTSGNTVFVPRDFINIQDAIESARGNDVIFVAPGRYKENIDFKGKAVTVRSEKGPERTIIDGGKKGPAVIFDSGEGNDSVFEGFTVCNGSGMLLTADDAKKSLKRDGGGIVCINSSPAIRNNIIRNNEAEDGGGICCLHSSSPLIADNIIKYNKSVKGGGIRCSLYSSPKIVNNRIFGNRVSRLGGGIYWRVGSFPFIDNNIIINNFAGEKGGGIFGSSHIKDQIGQKDVMLTGCIIRGNISSLGSSIALGGPSSAKVKIFHCDIESGKNSISDPENMIIFLPE